MIKYFFLISGMCFSHFVSAQNVGIGTTSPAAKLDVIGSVKITDGTEGANKILTSDANGLATWTAPPLPAFFTFTSDQSVLNGDYMGTSSSSSTLLRNNIVVPFNCQLTSIIFSIRQQTIGQFTATVYIQPQTGAAIATSLSATIVNGFFTYAVATGSVFINQGDLISVRITTSGSGLVSGAAVSVTYK